MREMLHNMSEKKRQLTPAGAWRTEHLPGWSVERELEVQELIKGWVVIILAELEKNEDLLPEERIKLWNEHMAELPEHVSLGLFISEEDALRACYEEGVVSKTIFGNYKVANHDYVPNLIKKYESRTLTTRK